MTVLLAKDGNHRKEAAGDPGQKTSVPLASVNNDEPPQQAVEEDLC
jgi:hypothetical protein